jgi:DtxR family Mn-dependent transcriptional regulator
MNNISSENYLKCIFHLQSPAGDPASTNEIAAHLGTKPSSVTSMLTKLAKSGMVEYTPYQGASLTKEGRKKAVQVVRKHRLWESFLVTKLGMSWDNVHEIAEQLEHIESEILVEKLDQFLGNPTSDPHGDPIPDSKGRIKQYDVITMDQVKSNESAIVRGVHDHSPAFLKHLVSVGLVPGQKIKVEKKMEFDGMMVIRLVPGNTLQHVSKTVAENILIESKK